MPEAGKCVQRLMNDGMLSVDVCKYIANFSRLLLLLRASTQASGVVDDFGAREAYLASSGAQKHFACLC